MLQAVLGQALVRTRGARGGRAAAALLLCLLTAISAVGGAAAQTPTVVPPGSGGVTFGTVRVTSGNDLPRNAGQENQPPVWITIDAKGSSAVVTVGNATQVALDFHGTVVLNLAPNVQATQVLVSTGTAVIQGNQVIWNGFSLASGEIEPSIVQLAPAGGGTPATAPANAISSVNIEAKGGQSGTAVTELVAGGGPAVSALRPAPGGATAGRLGSPAAPASVPLSQNTARTFGIVALALLVCTLLALALVATLVVSTARRLEQRLALAKVPAGAGLGEASRVTARSAPAGENRAAPPRARLVLQGGSQGGREWPLDGTEVGIGRSPRNQIVLADPRVSDRHAQVLRRDGDGYLLADSASTNGTFLNGTRIDAPTALHDGDELRVGTTTLTFRNG